MAIKTLNYKQIPLLDIDKIDGLGIELGKIATKVSKPGAGDTANDAVKYVILGNGGSVKLADLTHADLNASQIKYGSVAGRTVADEIAALSAAVGAAISVPKGQLHLYIGDDANEGQLGQLTAANVPVPASVTTALNTINDKIDDFEELGHIIGTADTYALLLSTYTSSYKGLTANDMVIVLADESSGHNGLTYIWVWNGTTWAKSFKFAVDLSASSINGLTAAIDDEIDARITAGDLAEGSHTHAKTDLTNFDANAFAAIKAALGLSAITSDGKPFAIKYDGTDYTVEAIPAAKVPSIVQTVKSFTTTAHQTSFAVTGLTADDKIEGFINGVYTDAFVAAAGQVNITTANYDFDVGEEVKIIIYTIELS